MTLAEAMRELESYGTAQNRKIYARHGVRGEMFGVSYANLYKMQKKIKVDHELARNLWATGNHDAQILATLTADPNRMTDKQVEEWAKVVDNYAAMEMLIRFLAKTSLARKKAEKWNKSKEEMIGAAGWGLIAQLALNDGSLPDEYFEPYIEIIERDIHKRKNRVRYEMNGALIAIGLRNSKLEKKALAAAKKIGKVEVDHGDTSCKTPDAAQYIAKALGYRHKKKAKAAGKD
jgi:3-methyladenine DNA glycosylase AlkD